MVCGGSPAPVPIPSAFPDQFKARTRAVGPPRWWFPATPLELHWPFDSLPLVCCGMQGPGGVVKVGAPERAEISTAGQDYRVDVVVTADGAYGDGRDSCCIAYAVCKRGLVAASKRGLFLGHGLSC